jgi:hypothetical protein
VGGVPAEVVEHLIPGVVPRNEGDAGTAMQPASDDVATRVCARQLSTGSAGRMKSVVSQSMTV